MSSSQLLFTLAACGYLLTGACLEGAHRLAAPGPRALAERVMALPNERLHIQTREPLVATLVKRSAAGGAFPSPGAQLIFEAI